MTAIHATFRDMEETRACKNCSQYFRIESDDFSFYEKIAVPAPTLCPHCRLIRRMVWRNERAWYRRTCAATGKNVLSMYHQELPLTVYDQEYWRGDAWEPLDYGREYDFSRGFFEQFKELWYSVPHPSLFQKNNVRCEYTNHTSDNKNCYLCASAVKCEDSAYLYTVVRHMRNCFDAHQSSRCEFSYEVIDSHKCSRVVFVQDCETCTDSMFLYNCRNCTNCFGCVGLRNAQYSIFNERYSKEEYKAHMEQLRNGGYAALMEAKGHFEALKLQVPRKYAAIVNAYNVSGDQIMDAKNCRDCFLADDNVEECSYCYRVWGNTKDGRDGLIAWDGSELFCDALSVTGQRIYFSAYIWGGSDMEYSYECFDCTNCFGCVGLRSKNYCIFNRPYEKEEYEMLVPKIRAAMRERGEYGEFFPKEFSPFAYNETIAQDYFPLTKEDAALWGHSWRDREARQYAITRTAEELPDRIADVADSILSETIGCAHRGECEEQCATAFRIIPEELQFYRSMNLPLPRLCPNCRHFNRVKMKTPLALYDRECMCEQAGHDHEGKCAVLFKTPYSDERPELIYCEACYQREVL